MIELVRGTLGETGLESETIGDYSYTRGESAGRVGRAGLARSILLSRPAYSMRIRSGWSCCMSLRKPVPFSPRRFSFGIRQSVK